VLFNTTIKQNIKMGKMDASDAEIEEALRAANAWDFVKELNEGVNTFCGAGGNQLSGGQKQRLALARAFIKKPKMFIFDEATSALDKNNERLVQQSIDSISKQLDGVTSIVIAHRLSTIRNADKILVMGKGKILEAGNHNELLS
jgi:ABC-type multidrug transport system fused ATPase/permease subunit